MVGGGHCLKYYFQLCNIGWHELELDIMLNNIMATASHAICSYAKFTFLLSGTNL